MKDFLYKLFTPKNAVAIIGIIATIVALIYLKSIDYNTVFAIPLYIFMSYFLIVGILRGYHFSINFKTRMNKFIDNNKYLSKYKQDYKIRVQVSLLLTLILNIIYAVFELTIGIINKSYWMISFGIYYLILVLMRLSISKSELKKEITKREEYKKYRFIGIISLFINLFLTTITLIFVNHNISFAYNEIVIITMAAYTFYILIINIISLIKYRKYKSPLINAAKVVNLITSLISILSLEIAMLSTYSADNPTYNKIMIILTSAGISLIVIATSIYMITVSTKYLKNNKE